VYPCGYNSRVTASEPLESARKAGLRYVTDDRPGIRRMKVRGGFRLPRSERQGAHRQDGDRAHQGAAIPPAYTDVWIAPIRNATCRPPAAMRADASNTATTSVGARCATRTSSTAWSPSPKRCRRFRAAVKRDLGRPGLTRETVLATVVSLLEATMIRVGNEEYARENDSHGLTTMSEEDVRVRGDAIRFHFRGKSGVEHTVTVHDKRLAKIVRNCQDIPGHELFSYLDERGKPVTIDSTHVNAYIRAIADDDFTAKDFRTWEATLTCARELGATHADSQREGKAAVLEAVRAVAKLLGNTPAVSKKAYIFPAIIDEFLATGALALVERCESKTTAATKDALSGDESRVLTFIENLITRDESRHLGALLATSVRQVKKTRAAAQAPARTSTKRQRSAREAQA
jgi:DNA topoisomerase-1